MDVPARPVESRLAGRSGDDMPSSLLASQLQTLERPGADDTDVERFSIDRRADEIIARATVALARGGG